MRAISFVTAESFSVSLVKCVRGHPRHTHPRATRRRDGTLRSLDRVPAPRGDVRGREISDETSAASARARRTTVMSRRTASTPPRLARRVALAATGALLLLSGASAQEDGVDTEAADIAIASMNHVQGGVSAAAEELPRLNTAGAEVDTARHEAALGGVRSNLGAHPEFQEFVTKHKGADHTYCPNLGPDEPCLEAMRRYARFTLRGPPHGTCDETPRRFFEAVFAGQTRPHPPITPKPPPFRRAFQNALNAHLLSKRRAFAESCLSSRTKPSSRRTTRSPA